MQTSSSCGKVAAFSHTSIGAQPVARPIVQRLCHMPLEYALTAFEVCNGPAHSEHSINAPRREPGARMMSTQEPQAPPIGAQAVTCIGSPGFPVQLELLRSAGSPGLSPTSLFYPSPDIGARFVDRLEIQGQTIRHDHVNANVDPIDQRARYPPSVSLEDPVIATASVRPVAAVAARAGVHRPDEDKSGRELGTCLSTNQRDQPFLERLTKGLERPVIELRQLVKEQNTAVRQCDLTRLETPTPSHQSRVADGVVRGTKRTGRSDPKGGFGSGRSDPGNLQFFIC